MRRISKVTALLLAGLALAACTSASVPDSVESDPVDVASLVSMGDVPFSFLAGEYASQLTVEPLSENTDFGASVEATGGIATTVSFVPEDAANPTAILMTVFWIPAQAFDAAANPNEPPMFGQEVMRSGDHVLSVAGPQDSIYDPQTADGKAIGALYDAMYKRANWYAIVHAEQAVIDAVEGAMHAIVDVKTQIAHPTDLGLWWINTSGYSIINDDAAATELRLLGCQDQSVDEGDRARVIAQLSKALNPIMKRQGFTPNPRNSSRSLADDRFYDYVLAWERDDVKAALVASPDCWSRADGPMYYSVDFMVAENFIANERAQLPLLRDLELRDVVVHVGKRDGAFALFNVNYRRTGHYIIAQYIDKHWKKIFAGQDVPPCSVMQQWNVPHTIASDCYTPE